MWIKTRTRGASFFLPQLTYLRSRQISNCTIKKMLQECQTETWSFLIICNFAGRLNWPSRCPGKRAVAEDKNGRDQTALFPSLFCFGNETQRERDGLGIKHRSPPWTKRDHCLLGARRMPFSPGMGPACHKENSGSRNPLKICLFLKENGFSSQPNWR